MVKKTGDAGRVGDRLVADVEWEKLKGFLMAHPEALEIRELIESSRQGLVLISNYSRAEAAVALFTSLLRFNPVVDWRKEYEEVSMEELIHDAEVLALPFLWEMPEGVVVMGHSLMPVKLRRLFLVLSSPDLHGLIVFSQPTLGLLVREGSVVYLGYKGVDPEGNRALIMEKARHDKDNLRVDFTGVKPRGNFLAIIQPR
ncbi:MAG: hypothetical protein RQ842_09995 [Vulcanisaeta sp.]|nr:hypothetical protein [Vulcanisaeta sp.]